MVEKVIRVGMCHVIHRYAKANNKFMEGYDPSRKLSYLMHWDVNNLYGWAISPKLPVNGFKWRKNEFTFNEVFIQEYDKDSKREYILEYPKKLHKLYSDLLFLLERIKIRKREKCVCNLHEKKDTSHLEAGIGSWTNTRKSIRVIGFIQKACQKLSIHMDMEMTDNKN